MAASAATIFLPLARTKETLLDPDEKTARRKPTNCIPGQLVRFDAKPTKQEAGTVGRAKEFTEGGGTVFGITTDYVTPGQRAFPVAVAGIGSIKGDKTFGNIEPYGYTISENYYCPENSTKQTTSIFVTNLRQTASLPQGAEGSGAQDPEVGEYYSGCGCSTICLCNNFIKEAQSIGLYARAQHRYGLYPGAGHPQDKVSVPRIFSGVNRYKNAARPN